MELFAGLLLILLSGFYAGSETALYRANWVRLSHRAKNRAPGARDALAALETLEPSLIATLLGTNLSGVFATLLVERYFVTQLGARSTPLAVALVVLLTLIFGEYLPKALARALPTRWLCTGGFLLNLSRYLFAPAILFITRLLPGGKTGGLTREHLVELLAQRHSRSPSRTAPASLAARLFRFSKIRVAEAAIPIKRVKSLPGEAPAADFIRLIAEFGYSRIPVYQKTPENITGVVLAKDLLDYLLKDRALKEKSPVPVRPVLRIPESTRALELLRRMQRAGALHLAVTVDSTGRATGIVTLEDLIEELIGEIRSED